MKDEIKVNEKASLKEFVEGFRLTSMLKNPKLVRISLIYCSIPNELTANLEYPIVTPQINLFHRKSYFVLLMQCEQWF